MNYVPREEPPALGFGKLLHVVFENHFNGMSMAEAIRTARCEWSSVDDPINLETIIRQGALKQLDDLTEPLLQWTDHYPIDQTLEVEEPFAWEIRPGFIIKGRPDRVVTIDNRVYHMQNRGLAPAVNFGLYTELAKRHYHEHVYAEALAKKYCDVLSNGDILHDKCFKYGGTLFNLVRKLKYRTKVTKAKPEGEVKKLSEMFFQHPMSIDLRGPLHAHVMESLWKHILGMKDTEEMWRDFKDIPAPNEFMNGGLYGNRMDEYTRVLTGEIELGDPHWFKPREDTYAVDTTQEES
jgi:hypothetical protein